MHVLFNKKILYYIVAMGILCMIMYKFSLVIKNCNENNHKHEIFSKSVQIQLGLIS